MTSAPELLAAKFPPLARYWPNLPSVSAQQAAFILLDQFEAFYGGAAGGGKSDALLAAALCYVDVPGYAALILRRTYRQLALADAIMSRSKEWLNGTDARWNEEQKTWTFPSGATLTFGHLEHEDDKYNYQGAAFQFVGWDELTQFNESLYAYLFSRSRRNKDLLELGIPIRHRSASNPGGLGHKWVRDRFVNEETRQPGAIFIPAKVDDNPGLDVEEYRQSLQHLDETLQQQLLDGDWGVFEGAAFVIRPEHVVSGFELDDSIVRFEALDYGLNGAPWALWSIDYEGNLIATDMRYWRDTLPSDIAPDIVDLRKRTWGLGNVCWADPSLWKRTGGKNRWGQPAMLNEEFSDNGVPLKPANNDPRAGLVRLRELLKLDPEHQFPGWHPRAGEYGAPRVFITAACSELLDELKAAPLLPSDKKDGGEIIDPAWEGPHGHAVAMARYAVMSKPEPSEVPEKPLRELLLEPEERSPADLRRERFQRHIERVQKPLRRALLSHDHY